MGSDRGAYFLRTLLTKCACSPRWQLAALPFTPTLHHTCQAEPFMFCLRVPLGVVAEPSCWQLFNGTVSRSVSASYFAALVATRVCQLAVFA
jgi:hypothetical protein